LWIVSGEGYSDIVIAPSHDHALCVDERVEFADTLSEYTKRVYWRGYERASSELRSGLTAATEENKALRLLIENMEAQRAEADKRTLAWMQEALVKALKQTGGK
jgi:hypothetical protein